MTFIKKSPIAAAAIKYLVLTTRLRFLIYTPMKMKRANPRHIAIDCLSIASDSAVAVTARFSVQAKKARISGSNPVFPDAFVINT